MENNENEHLALISEMINIARKEFDDDSWIYLLWGWTVCLSSLGEYVLLMMGKDYHAIVWLLMPVAAIAQLLVSFRKKKTVRVKTHMDKVIGYVWIAVGICIGIVLFSQLVLRESTFPVLILLYGIGTFISGGIMNLKPMKAGGICCWIIALVAFHVTFEYQLLLLSLSLIISYIIPGHLLKLRFKNNV